MPSLEAFLRPNREKRENVFYTPIENMPPWELRHLSSEEEAQIRRDATRDGNTDGDAYLTALVCQSVVFPPLHDVSLLDSYGVMKPSEVVMKIVDCPGDWARLCRFVLAINRLDEEKDIETAKN